MPVMAGLVAPFDIVNFPLPNYFLSLTYLNLVPLFEIATAIQESQSLILRGLSRVLEFQWMIRS